MNRNEFEFKTLVDVSKKAEELAVDLPLSNSTAVLFEPLNIGGRRLPNRLAISPMEGRDATWEGRPTQRTLSRYLPYAKSGVGLIWFEAVSIFPEGRSSLHQLQLNEETVGDFSRLIKNIKEECINKHGFSPFIIMQESHHGRFTQKNINHGPITTYGSPLFSRNDYLEDNSVVTDAYLDRLPDGYSKAAYLAKKAGFDGIDIKASHGHLLGESLSAYLRPGKYGGSFEHRSRLLLNCMRSARKAADQDFMVTLRLGIYDGISYPYGWGVSSIGGLEPDYREPLQLVKYLQKYLDLELINITMGNAGKSSHLSQPCDGPDRESPLTSMARMVAGARCIKEMFPELIVMGSAPSYLRHLAPNFVAGAINEGYCDLMGFGRLALAHPYFGEELRQLGRVNVDVGAYFQSMNKVVKWRANEQYKTLPDVH